jgi:hypothetical protein
MYTEVARSIEKSLAQEGIRIVHGRTGASRLNSKTQHERKQAIFDCIVVLPGGVETFEEAMEAISLRSMNLFSKPILIVNVADFYDNLILQMRRAESEGMTDVPVEALVTIVDNAEDAVKWCLDQEVKAPLTNDQRFVSSSSPSPDGTWLSNASIIVIGFSFGYLWGRVKHHFSPGVPSLFMLGLFIILKFFESEREVP